MEENSNSSEKKVKPNDVGMEENFEEESQALVSFNILKPPKNVIERYCNQYFLIGVLSLLSYFCRYKWKCQRGSVHLSALKQVNYLKHLIPLSLCIVGVAPSHPLCDKSFSISKVDFDVGNKNRLQNEIHGKKKKVGLILC